MSEEDLLTIGSEDGSLELNLRLLDGFNISIKTINIEETSLGIATTIMDRYNNRFYSYSKLLQKQIENVNKYIIHKIHENERKYIMVGVSVNSVKQVFLTTPYKNELFEERTDDFLSELQLIDEHMKLEKEKRSLERRIQKGLRRLKYGSSDNYESMLCERKEILNGIVNKRRKRDI